ncbi:CMP-sialic acid transporter [Plakobranchus ocellatus]|uniref:CMP-sialic acid transporter n=1 Tax=Plakobranchus ocellatus TaxID=259542 RepID=A0AAV4B4X3_9GAST|nr:CMP-sialic acid transporter [Plakobranchus ocellatus]
MTFLRIPLKDILWPCIIVAEVIMYGMFPVLIDLSTVGDEISFLSSSFNFCTEALKFMVCVVILRFQSPSKPAPRLSLGLVLPFSVPALLYCVNNNVSVLVQTEMDPATFMVLSNLKILFTAALYRLFFRKKLGHRKLFAICLLTCGGIFNSMAALSSKSSHSLSEIHVTWIGLITLCCYCFISGFSGVFTEFIFKKDHHLSVYLQNAILYSFGMVFSFVGWLLQARNRMMDTGNCDAFNLFYGYTVFTWALVLTQVPTGLIISMIMKFSNNMVRLFVIASAPLVTTVLSSILFGLKIQAEFVVSAVLIIISAILYNMNAQTGSKTLHAAKKFENC